MTQLFAALKKVTRFDHESSRHFLKQFYSLKRT